MSVQDIIYIKKYLLWHVSLPRKSVSSTGGQDPLTKYDQESIKEGSQKKIREKSC